MITSKISRRSLLLDFIIHEWQVIISYIGWEDNLAMVAILIGALGYNHGFIQYIQGWRDFYYDIRSDLIALGITVLIIDNVNEIYRRRAEKERLILQMGSPEHIPAIEAARQLRLREWLFYGSLRGAYLNGADLRGADLRDADLFGAHLNGANLSGANLSGADLSRADLSEANLRGANLRDAKLFKADLPGANLRGTNLRGANLFRTDLRDADLRDADLCRVDLLREADLGRTIYNNRTKWPDNFDPGDAGLYSESVHDVW